MELKRFLKVEVITEGWPECCVRELRGFLNEEELEDVWCAWYVHDIDRTLVKTKVTISPQDLKAVADAFRQDVIGGVARYMEAVAGIDGEDLPNPKIGEVRVERE